MTYISRGYLLIFLIIRINSAKNALSPIFELKSMAKPQKHVPDVIGLYQATNETSNNFIVYKRLGTEMYIFVTRRGFWAVNKKLPPNTEVLYRSRSADETINEEPPVIGWQYRETNEKGWKHDETIKWKKFDCCDEINITSSSTHGIRYYRPELKIMGNYRKTELTNAGRFVYHQVDGNNVLFYVDKEGWRIGENVDESFVFKYDSPSSCPFGKQSPKSIWKYAGKTSGWWKEKEAQAKCLIHNVSNVICLIETQNITESKPCKFPFRFRGEVHDGCIADHNNPSKSWCSIGEETKDGVYKYDDTKWGYCEQNCTNQINSDKHMEDLPLPLSAIIVLSAMTPLVVLLVIGLSVYAIRNLHCNCARYKDKEIVEQNPVYGIGDDDDDIEATDANSIYGDEDDEYENIENA